MRSIRLTDERGFQWEATCLFPPARPLAREIAKDTQADRDFWNRVQWWSHVSGDSIASQYHNQWPPGAPWYEVSFPEGNLVLGSRKRVYALKATSAEPLTPAEWNMLIAQSRQNPNVHVQSLDGKWIGDQAIIGAGSCLEIHVDKNSEGALWNLVLAFRNKFGAAWAPYDFSQQAEFCDFLSNLSFANLDAVTQKLHGEIVQVLSSNEIALSSSYCRTKTLDSINLKRDYRSLTEKSRQYFHDPIIDIHGVTVVLHEPLQLQAAAEVIFDRWPTPEKLFGHMDRSVDYSQFNHGPRPGISDPHYSATHLRLRIQEGARYAEVRLFTEDDQEFHQRTAAAYKEKMRRAVEEGL